MADKLKKFTHENRARQLTEGPRRNKRDADQVVEINEKVIFINRSSKVVKGGRRFNFSALIVVGDRNGNVGLGLGKAGEVAECIRKGNENAKQRMVEIGLKDGTIPHEVLSDYGGATVLLKPACPGTGVIAGKVVRAVLEAVGVKDVLTKSMGSNNAANVAKATLAALLQLRMKNEIYENRGMSERESAPPPKEEVDVASPKEDVDAVV